MVVLERMVSVGARELCVRPMWCGVCMLVCVVCVCACHMWCAVCVLCVCVVCVWCVCVVCAWVRVCV